MSHRRTTVAPMKNVEFFLWWIIDPAPGRHRRTSYRMNREAVEPRFPGTEPLEDTREVSN